MELLYILDQSADSLSTDNAFSEVLHEKRLTCTIWLVSFIDLQSNQQNRFTDHLVVWTSETQNAQYR